MRFVFVSVSRIRRTAIGNFLPRGRPEFPPSYQLAGQVSFLAEESQAALPYPAPRGGPCTRRDPWIEEVLSQSMVLMMCRKRGLAWGTCRTRFTDLAVEVPLVFGVAVGVG